MEFYNNWHKSALKKINHEYHIVQNGVLNKKDYSLIFENEKEKCDIPIGIVDRINIYSDVTISSVALRLLAEKNIRMTIVDKYGNSVCDFIPAKSSKTGVAFLKQALFYQSNKRLEIAKKLEIASIHNIRANIKYYNRRSENSFDDIIAQINDKLILMKAATKVEELMLIEAQTRQIYYGAFNLIIKQVRVKKLLVD